MRIVIVGGGFGGVRAALSLANKKGLEIKLVSDQSYFEYHAALYRSATGRSPLEVAIPLKEFFKYAKNIEVVEDTIESIEPKSTQVVGKAGSRYVYDKLILALGNTTEYYGIKGLQKYSYGIKTIHEALRLKRKLHQQLLEKQADHNYVVVGAGASGVELSAELIGYLKKIRKKHRTSGSFKVNLIEASMRPVAAMPVDYSHQIAKRLKQVGVKLLFNTPVESESASSINLPNTKLESHTVVWTAGVSNNPIYKKHKQLFEFEKNKVIVNDYLMTQNDIYVIGDSAFTRYSGMAQTAIYDAKYVAKNILRELRGKPVLRYKPKKPIYAIPVGPRWAAVRWGNINIYGRMGWLLRRAADLRLFISFLPFKKAISIWRYGFVDDEVCQICGKI